jgi:aryl-alcohol dehydrogenase-like predicted oxidoreductase
MVNKHCLGTWAFYRNNFIDIADNYGMDHSEIIIGKTVKHICDKVIIHSKFGNWQDDKK